MLRPAALLVLFSWFAAAAQAGPGSEMIPVTGGGLRPYALAATEVPWPLYAEIRDWAATRGYDIASGQGEEGRPVQAVTWYDAVKWCNALSERVGRRPVYYTDAAKTNPYRRGLVDVEPAWVDDAADGFRLPGKQEWEQAFRAGTTKRYFWGDFPRSDRDANLPHAVVHYWQGDNSPAGPAPAGTRRPNPWGFFDLAGNMEEWVFDAFVPPDVGEPQDGLDAASRLRILKGGSFVLDRQFHWDADHPTYPWFQNIDIGFRIASSDPEARVNLPALPPAPPHPRAAAPFSRNPEFTKRDPALAASVDRALPFLSRSAPALGPFWTLIDAGKVPEAAEWFRGFFLELLRKSSLRFKRPDIFRPAEADRWLARSREGRSIRWFLPQSDHPTAWFQEGDDLLAKAFLRTGRLEYLDAYCWYARDMALNARPWWLALTLSEREGSPAPGPADYACLFSHGFDAGNALRGFQILAEISRSNVPGVTERIPVELPFDLIFEACHDLVGSGLQDDRSNVPNQILANGLCLYQMGLVLDILRDAPLWRAIGAARLVAAAGTVLPDGTDLEFSLNYNKHFIDEVDAIVALQPPGRPVPPWLAELRRKATDRARMFLGVATPFASWPALAKQSNERERPKKLMQRWAEEGRFTGLEAITRPFLFAEPAGDAPPFRSISFPFGGYHVQRSGWGERDCYLFLRASPPGLGHNRKDINSLQVAAQGNWLLLSAGPPSYEQTNLAEDQKSELPFVSAGFFDRSVAANTVLVEGFGQVDLHRMDPVTPAPTPLPNRVLISEDCDFAEGFYRGRYAPEPPWDDTTVRKYVETFGDAATEDLVRYQNGLKEAAGRGLEADHHRQVFFSRRDGFWIVTDQVNAGSVLTQTWNLPPPDAGGNKEAYFVPGFAPDDVVMDAAGKSLLARRTTGPGLAIRHFLGGPVTYEKSFGRRYPHEGWFSFGIIGRRVPAVLLKATWKRAGAPLVTVLQPLDAAAGAEGEFTDRSTADSSGFALTRGNVTLEFHCADAPVLRTFGDLRVQARVVLWRREAEDVQCVVLGAERFVWQGKPLEVRDAAVHLRGVPRVVPIRVPEGFAWREGPQGLRPELFPKTHGTGRD